MSQLCTFKPNHRLSAVVLSDAMTDTFSSATPTRTSTILSTKEVYGNAGQQKGLQHISPVSAPVGSEASSTKGSVKSRSSRKIRTLKEAASNMGAMLGRSRSLPSATTSNATGSADAPPPTLPVSYAIGEEDSDDDDGKAAEEYRTDLFWGTAEPASVNKPTRISPLVTVSDTDSDGAIGVSDQFEVARKLEVSFNEADVPQIPPRGAHEEEQPVEPRRRRKAQSPDQAMPFAATVKRLSTPPTRPEARPRRVVDEGENDLDSRLALRVPHQSFEFEKLLSAERAERGKVLKIGMTSMSTSGA